VWSWYTRGYLKLRNQRRILSPPSPRLQQLDVIQRDEIEFIDSFQAATGTFGQVLRGRWRGQSVAVKDIIESRQMSQQNIRDFEKEAEVMSRVSHHNCVKLLGTCQHPDDLALVMEWMDGGNFYQALGRTELSLPVHKRITVVRQIAAAVHYLHSLNPPVVHGDIKSMNVMLSDSNSDGYAKLADFGLSKIRGISSTMRIRSAGSSANHIAGTVHYMAPEMFDGQSGSTTSSDVYALGILLYEAITGKVPWDKLNPSQVSAQLTSGKLPPLQQPYGMSTDQFHDLNRLYNDCCKKLPGLRPPASVVAALLAAIDVNNPDNNTEVQLLPANFNSACQTLQSCLHPIPKDAALMQMYTQAFSQVDVHLRDVNRQSFMRDHGLSYIEAACIALYTWEPADHSPHAPYKVFNFACRTRNRNALVCWQNFAFHLCNGLR
jgi:serine/threonine-protein kinase CTR1